MIGRKGLRGRIFKRKIINVASNAKDMLPVSLLPLYHTDGIRTQMALISDSCPENVWRQVPSRTSHSLAVASQAPEMNSLKSGETAKLIQSPV